jgi:hypothetical protein
MLSAARQCQPIVSDSPVLIGNVGASSDTSTTGGIFMKVAALFEHGAGKRLEVTSTALREDQQGAVGCPSGGVRGNLWWRGRAS